jgi:hypothetical protein
MRNKQESHPALAEFVHTQHQLVDPLAINCALVIRMTKRALAERACDLDHLSPNA